ncbi:MAG: FumA C-terminus/TtdB family hydratase beta subunit [Nitrososphaerota archaeon]
MGMEYYLQTPLTESNVRKLKIGDVVYLSGLIHTARDEAHMYILKELTEGRCIDICLDGAAIYHCGPIVRIEDGCWKVVAAGPTTSSRMNALEPEFIEKTGAKAIIGKGGMSRTVAEVMKRLGAVYLAFTGGAAVVAADSIRKVAGVYFLELGMPEAVWIFDVENFGPLIVGIDSSGQSLFDNIYEHVKMNLKQVRKKLGINNVL